MADYDDGMRRSANGGDNVFRLSISGDAVRRNLGGDDTVKVRAGDDIEQVRLTFTSTEVGDGARRDSGTMAN